MRVLQVTPSFHPAYVYGGPTRSVYDLCRYLAATDCELKVLTTDANGPTSVLDVDTKNETRDPNGFDIRYCHRIRDVSVSPALLSALPGYIRWSDVVHVTAVYSFPTIPTLALCRMLGKPVVWSPRGMFQRWEGATRGALKSVWNRVCKVAAPRGLRLHFTSEDEAVESVKHFTGFEYAVIPNCIDVPESTIQCASTDGVLRMLYLGRLHPIKGIESLLGACAKLGETSCREWRLTIAGDGDEEYVASLKSFAGELGILKRVGFAGTIAEAEKQQVFSGADVVIVPSHRENFGIVVAEALANGKPVIAGHGTPWHRLDEVGCGLWVDNSAESLAEAIARASTMPLAEMGGRGRQWMSSEFSGPAMAQQMLRLYAAAIGFADSAEFAAGPSVETDPSAL